ncbi:MAG: hypothetical protein H6611_04620 [Ignavibacteriales bacterium]|nr:hypothetical protein [Ignavibacteriales bacterium]
MQKACQYENLENLYEILLNEAKRIHNEDVEMCEKIGENGFEIFKKKSVVLTHW